MSKFKSFHLWWDAFFGCYFQIILYCYLNDFSKNSTFIHFEALFLLCRIFLTVTVLFFEGTFFRTLHALFPVLMCLFILQSLRIRVMFLDIADCFLQWPVTALLSMKGVPCTMPMVQYAARTVVKGHNYQIFPVLKWSMTTITNNCSVNNRTEYRFFLSIIFRHNHLSIHKCNLFFQPVISSLSIFRYHHTS